mmetsp:Transcript_36474/g.79829  ORF Transcript_36474/g.79829 Transcript_36474/m.79829 type:complete len:270 (-) Transcript_36474:39-848(-)|eukprot:CAMPEP_0170603280 /NCGR_PEP_ID=MMETSP0224-20130122/18829_1 /TAXON_ID=285029 /ORGANISM="Togula jolla, Strain CCCM 725" /LENGTH=269 /DNA_ID=CAMNT_0010928153 /DNA_START=47 /DNA_END=856 /DNA_ORIENTATION=+
MTAAVMETLTFGDGSTADVPRQDAMDEDVWREVRKFLVANPEIARSLRDPRKDSETMRRWLKMKTIAEYYDRKLELGDASTRQSLEALQLDRDLAVVFDDIRRNGLEAAWRHSQNEELLVKIGNKMGGLPGDVEPALKQITATSLTLHEACKSGAEQLVREHLSKKCAVDALDQQGVTPLGYSIGANRVAIVKLLLDAGANPFRVDSSGNSALHYAAGYGRFKLVEYFCKLAGDPKQVNSDGQTALDVATTNSHSGVAEIIEKYLAMRS